jgi:hypothetical protein
MFILSISLISKAFAPDSIFDGYKRVAALEQLGRDTVEAVIWPLNEVQVLVLDRSLHWSECEKAGCSPSWSNVSALGWKNWPVSSIAV